MVEQTMGSLFGMNADKEKSGIVIQFGDKLRVRLARAGGGNTKFATVVEEERRPFARLIATELLPEDLAQQIMHRAYARAVVLEWSGMVDDGVEVPFSVDACIAMFKKYPEFFHFVYGESAKLSNFRAAAREQESGN